MRTPVQPRARVHPGGAVLVPFVVAALLVVETAVAEPASSGDDGPHRPSAEVGAFQHTKWPGIGVVFGLGYAYRLVRGLDAGGSLRAFVMPDHESESYLTPAVGSTEPLQHGVDPGYHFYTVDACLRPFLPLGAADRFELGLELRAGLLLRDSLVLGNVAVAPDVRVRIAGRTALQLAAEFMIGGTGLSNDAPTEDRVDVIFAQEAVFLGVVETL
jgi:hypothetical protein